MKDLIGPGGGKELGEERFNWRRAVGEERLNRTWRGKAFG